MLAIEDGQKGSGGSRVSKDGTESEKQMTAWKAIGNCYSKLFGLRSYGQDNQSANLSARDQSEYTSVMEDLDELFQRFEKVKNTKRLPDFAGFV